MTRVTASGPLFDGRAASIADAMTADCADQVAGQASADVHQILDQSIRNPTPYYETQINVRRQAASTRVVNDNGVIYGPWLARGRDGTKFRGYDAFRRAAQQVQGRVPSLVAPVVARWLEKLR